MNRLAWLFLFLLGAFHPQQVRAQSFSLKQNRKSESTAFQFVNNLIIIPIQINGNGPYNFVLDTGIGMILITDSCLIDAQNFARLRTIKINGLGEGGEISAHLYPSAKIDLAKSITGNIPVAVLNNDPFNLSSYLGMPIHGLIGYDLLNSFTVAINYVTRRITYYADYKVKTPKKGQIIPISIEDRKPYLNIVITPAGGKKENAKIIIDTGAGHPLSLETRNGVAYQIPEKSIKANLGVGLSGEIHGYLNRMPSVEIGKYILKNVICAFPDYSNAGAKAKGNTRNGNVGNNILKKFNVVFDYKNEAIYLKPNYNFKEPFEHTMSGMELTAEGANYNEIVVARVEPGSAADLIGLAKNDRILSINLKKVELIGFEEIINTFRSRNNRTIILEVYKDSTKETEVLLLTLKRRI
ncbi:MAG TPA: aspartyl protease family protein [Pedobacter sp.]|jgi:hypothetical protein